MEWLDVVFPVSGVQTNLLVPPLVALVISFFTSMGGVSGAFLLLPFQMSVLHYTVPSVSGTNHVYNIVAIPSGVYRFVREGRMAWPLTWVIVAGTLPGVFFGYLIRVRYLPDPSVFKLFVGCVLLYVGARLVLDLFGRDISTKSPDHKFKAGPRDGGPAGLPSDARVRFVSYSLQRVEYEFWGERFSFSTPGMFMLSLVVGLIGGAYGIGGGAIIAPFCVAVFGLPVYSIAGAALMGTFVTSVAGALFFTLLPELGGVNSRPDWLLGFLFGVGGFAGVYLGARFQKYVPQKIIKSILGAAILFLAARYVLQFFVSA